MAKKDKEEKKKDKKDDDKLSSQEKQLKEIEDEITKLLDDMKVVLGEDGVPDVKVVSSNKISKKKVLLFQLIEVLVSIAILVGLTGYVKWFRCEELYYYFIVIGGISIIDFILGYLINRFGTKLIFYSLGLVMLAPSIISFTIAGFLIPLIGTINIGKLMLVGILYMIVKRVLMRIIKGNNSSFRIKTIK